MRLCEETRPKEKVVAAPGSAGPTPRRPGDPPRRLLVRVASMKSGPSGHSSSRQTGAGSASMPTLWSVNHREPFNARHASVWVPPVAGFPAGLIRVIGGQACNGLASSPRLGQQCSQVPSRLGSDRHTCDHARLSLAPPWPYKTKPEVEK